MFDWVVDGVRYIGWIIYAGMLYFVSSIYNTLTSIPNTLSNVLNNDTVNSLFNASRNLFIIFVGLMIVVIVLSRMFDWNVNKMMNQMKKIFLLCLILLALPWVFNKAEALTNSFIASSNNVMIDESNNSTTTDLGVSMANIYIYKNDKYEDSKDYGQYSDEPFHNLGDITDGEMINQKMKDTNGDDVYVYSYLNPILGLLLNVALIGLLILTTFKVYGYLYNIVVIKIWIPIKMIYDGFNDTPVSEAIYEIIAAFMSFAIQLIIIPFSIVMLDVFTSTINDNLFLEIVSVFVALWFMFTGVDYIQSKFQGKSGIPTVLEAYGVMRLAQAGVNTAKGVLPSGDSKVKPEDIEKTNLNDENINTGREQDINNEHGETSDENIGADGVNPSESEGTSNLDETIDNNIANDNLQAVDENMFADNVFDNDDYADNMMNQTVGNEQMINDEDDISLNKDEMNNINEDINMRANDNESRIEGSGTNENNDVRLETPNINNSSGDLNVEDKTPNITFPATEKQIEFAKSLGIETEGKNKYELGNDIQQVTTGQKSTYAEPKYEAPNLDSNDTESFKKLEKLLKEDSGFD